LIPAPQQQIHNLLKLYCGPVYKQVLQSLVEISASGPGECLMLPAAGTCGSFIQREHKKHKPQVFKYFLGMGRTPPPPLVSVASQRLRTSCPPTPGPLWRWRRCPIRLPAGASSIHALSPTGSRINAFSVCWRQTSAFLQNYRQPRLSPIFHTSFVKRTVITLEESLEEKCRN
jgi:hypothetical protein